MSWDASWVSHSVHPDLAATAGLVALMVYSILVATGNAQFLPYHAIVEFVVAAVSVSAFYISWHTRNLVEDDFMTFIGITQLYVGCLTVLHLLGYAGMGVLWPWNPNAGLGSQFWIIMRGVQAVGFVAAPFFMGRNPKRLTIASLALGLPALAAVYAVLAGEFPATNIPGVGLTPFKIASEAVIVTLMVLALSLLRRRASEFPRRASRDLQLSIVLMIAAELLFMVYRGPFDVVSVGGHVVHVAATYFLYHALIVRRLEDPFSTLFYRLHRSEQVVRSVVENVHDGVTMRDLTTGRYLLANPRTVELGELTPEEIQEWTVAHTVERIHPDDREKFTRALHAAEETATPQTVEYRWRKKNGEYRWFRHQMTLASDSDSRSIGLVGTVQDVTEEMRSERHRKLLEDISRDFATYSSPDELLCAVAERMAVHLEAEAAYFLDIDAANDTAWIGGFKPAIGVLPSGQPLALSSIFTPAFRVSAAANETMVIERAEGDPRVSSRVRELADFPLESAICVPSGHDGAWQFMFVVVGSKPRCWLPDEVELTKEVGNRLYWRVQRARAEIALRHSEARQAYLLQLVDGLTGLGPSEIRTRSARLLGECVGATHAFYAELVGDGFVIDDAYSSHDAPDVSTTFSADDFPRLLSTLQQGRPIVVRDVSGAELVSPQERDLLTGLGILSFVCVPLLHDGLLAAMMMVCDMAPRTWSPFEVGLVEETAERACSRLIAARAQDELRASLERTRLLQELAASSASSLDSAELSQRTLRVAGERLGAEVGVVYLLQGESGVAMAVAHFGANAALSCPNEVSIDDDSPVARALRTGEIQTWGLPGDKDDADPWAGTEAMKDHRVACIPLIMRNVVIGLLGLAFPVRRPFDQSEIDLYTAVADQLSVGLENARLYEVEHGIAETLQETLVVLPIHVPGIHFSRAYESATYQSGRVGGDFIDVFEVRGNIVGITLGDVSGKGIDAAVTTSLVRNTIRVHAADGLPPAQVAMKANVLIRRFTEVGSFVTLWFGLLNTKTGQLRYVSAGHPPALVVSRGGEVAELTSADPILGVLDEATYFEHQTVLAPGERLLLYSDGVTEARSPQGRFLGEDGLRMLIASHADISTSSLSEAIMTDVISLSEGVLRDDAALLVVEPSRLVSAVKDDGQMQAFLLD